MQAFLNPKEKHGKQSLKSLTKRGTSIENVEVSGDNIASFKKIARKYDVDFALKKDVSTDPPNWLVFFKSKESKALEAAFKEYSREVLKAKTPKPSIEKTMEKAKEIVKTITPPTPTKSRGKGDVEL